MNLIRFSPLLALVSLVLFVGFSTAQEKNVQSSGFDNCETIAWKLDAVGNDFLKTNGKKVLIIVEVRPKGTSSEKSKSRLRSAKSYLVKNFDIADERIITAISYGDETESAHIRFYSGGELYVEIDTSRNSGLCIGPDGGLGLGT